MSDTAKKEAPAADKKSEHGKEADGHGAPAAKGGIGGMLKKTPVLLGIVMVVEAVLLVAGLKILGGGPKNAAGAEVAAEKSDEKGEGKSTEKKGMVELSLVEFRAPNKQSGHTFLYDIAIFVTTKGDTADKAKELISSDDALIKDRVRTIIATIDPEKLGGGSEPGLETLRRQVKYQLDQFMPPGMIEEVLVPRCIPFRTDY